MVPRSLPSRSCALLVLATFSAGCGGGGGGGGGGGDDASLTVTPATLAFTAFEEDEGSESRSVSVAWTGSNFARYVVGTLPGVTRLPDWLQVSVPSVATSPSTVTVERLPFSGFAAGVHSTTLRFVSGDVNDNVIKIVDVPVSLQVIDRPAISPSILTMSWVESERPASQELTITRPDSRVQIVSATADVPWLSATVAGDTVTVVGNAAAEAVPPGQEVARVSIEFSLPTGARSSIDVPVDTSVAYALEAPALIELTVDGSTQAADLLNRAATLTSVTQAPVQFDAISNVAWLTGSSGTTGAPGNLTMSLQGTEIRELPAGEHDGLLTITPTTPNVTPVDIPVRLTLNLPEVRMVMPVAFTDTVATDYVVVHGRGLADPNVDLRVAGAVPLAVTVVDDRTLHVVPGPHAAGLYPVTVANDLGFDRSAGTLRVVDPPAYAAFSLDAVLGLQSRVVSSPVNRAVYSAMCYFCDVTQVGTPGTIHRFGYDGGTGQWTHTEVRHDALYDVVLSPDESKLIVLTETQLKLADPVTMMAAAADTFTLPEFRGGVARQLAVAGNGLVIIGDSSLAFSLLTRSFEGMPIGYPLGRAPVASLDGSRVLLPFHNTEPAWSYDPATGEVRALAVTASDSRASFDRHGTVAFSATQVLDASYALRGTLPVGIGEVAPDGSRVYHADVDLSDVRVFDITAGANFGQEFAPIDVPGVPGSVVARVAVDPRGQHLFYLTEHKFIVLVAP